MRRPARERGQTRPTAPRDVDAGPERLETRSALRVRGLRQTSLGARGRGPAQPAETAAGSAEGEASEPALPASRTPARRPAQQQPRKIENPSALALAPPWACEAVVVRAAAKPGDEFEVLLRIPPERGEPPRLAACDALADGALIFSPAEVAVATEQDGRTRARFRRTWAANGLRPGLLVQTEARECWVGLPAAAGGLPAEPAGAKVANP